METRDTSIVFVPCVLTHSRPKEPHYLHVGIPVTCCESIGVMFGMLHMFYVEVVIKPFFFFFGKHRRIDRRCGFCFFFFWFFDFRKNCVIVAVIAVFKE